MIKMEAPQIALVILYIISLILVATRHGKPKEGNENILYNIISTVIVFGILIWGGFFKV